MSERDRAAVPDCAAVVEEISARLDGESALPDDVLDDHLAACPDCRQFAADAARVTRLARTAPAESVPDLVATVLADADAQPRQVSPRTVVRGALAAVAAGQLGLAVVGLLAAGHAGHGEPTLSGASLVHLGHETSAWNLALGVAFLRVATLTRRSAGLVPLLAAFVGVLSVLSVLDVIAGRVDGGRLVVHGLIVVGLVLVVVLDRLLPDGGTGPAVDTDWSGFEGPVGSRAQPGPRATGGLGTAPAARDRAA